MFKDTSQPFRDLSKLFTRVIETNWLHPSNKKARNFNTRDSELFELTNTSYVTCKPRIQVVTRWCAGLLGVEVSGGPFWERNSAALSGGR